jgi:hypothetical protein
MIELKKCLKLLEDGFSLITVGENKIPNYKWQKQQSEPLTPDQFTKKYNYTGGYFFKDSEGKESELPPTKHIGIVTGYGFLECIDIDLKVFSTAKEQKEWWEEYISFLEDNILDFQEKFVIAKTKNNGYHILFKSKRVEGNTKIAKLKGQKEAIIETRGIGGYVFIYENFLNNKSYRDIDFISDNDRVVLFALSKTYDYIEPEKIQPDKQSKKEFQSNPGDITPWDDFNQKNQVWDIVSDDFVIVRNLNNKYIIKRHNAESAHSGYIYKDEDLMFLHSTGTIYEANKQYSAFTAYVRKKFNDNFSEATKQIYKDGYGSRLLKKIAPIDEPIKVDRSKLSFPIEIFPTQIQDFIITANETLNNSLEYMCCSLLWAVSVSIGNAIKIEVVPGWTENSTLWLALVGQPGWGKTPSIKRIISPLQKLNSREVKKYYKELEKFEHYDSLTKKEKNDHPEVRKPIKRQFIANDITLEALVDLHQESDNSVGVFKDELAGWFKDMNKYREGSDLEFWLSVWSGSPVILTRVTRKGSYIQRPSIPVLGGIQPNVLTNFNTSENRENGFMDRILLCYPDLKSEYLSNKRIDYDLISWFNDTIVGFYETIVNKVVKRDSDGEIEPLISVMSKDAFDLYNSQHKNITDRENNEEISQYLKSMLPKQKAYIARFALIIHVFNDYFEQNGNSLEISKESMAHAISLSEYFIENAKKVKSDNIKVNEIKNVINKNKYKTNHEKFAAMYKENPDVCKKEAAEQLGVSIQMIYRYKKELEN